MAFNTSTLDAAREFIRERLELLLGRLEQLGGQIREAVARVVGTTVAEAISESVRALLHLLPHRRGSPSYAQDRSDDPYDPSSDSYDSDYQPEPRCRPVWDWHKTAILLGRFVINSVGRFKSWTITRWAIFAAMAALSLPASEQGELPEPMPF